MSPRLAKSNYPGFPPQNGYISSKDSFSVVTTHATALDVCRSIYGDKATSASSVDALYEANARMYENPLLTTTSRSVIGDIHRLTNSLSVIDIPRPLAALCTLFRLQTPKNTCLDWLSSEPLFRVIRVWTDIEDITEHESFDGHKKALVEHTLHILLLPGIHLDNQRLPVEHSGSLVAPVHGHSTLVQVPSIPPWLPIPGTSLSIPSPLHFKLHVVTRLLFNEQGLVTHHRDIWDIKDVFGLMPGISLAQWIGTRITAAGLSFTSRLWLTIDSSHSSAQFTRTCESTQLVAGEGVLKQNAEPETNIAKNSEYHYLKIWHSV